MEKSIIKKFRKEIWSKFIRAIKEYELIKEGDKIAVYLSGGKDSFLMTLCFLELERHKQINFAVEYIVMDPGYDEEHINFIKHITTKLNIPIKIIKTDIFKIVKKHGQKDPCYLCSRMRRGSLYAYAQSLNCNKIALGHHQDDVVETILLNILYNGIYKTMMPKVKAKNFLNMELIRPLYLIREKDIKRFCKYNNLIFSDRDCNLYIKDSKREKLKEAIDKLDPLFIKNIINSTSNVYLDFVIGYKKDNKKTKFLDEF